MKPITHWMPAAFCGFLSLLVIGSVFVSPSPNALAPVFLCWLPMCFVFVGSVTARMHREILDLRKQLAELQHKPAP